MTNETRLAFEHPEARASDMRDRISLREHIVDVEIGAFQAERGVTQRLSFNVVVEIADLPPDLDDDVDLILSYDRVTEAISFELGAERLNLLETLAERVADRILLEPQAERVFVRIEKLDRGSGRLGVEIMRHKGEADAREGAGAPRPRVAYLANESLQSAVLPEWVAQLKADGTPLILCLGPHEQPLPDAATAASARRIALLGIEQNAWRLAARLEGCEVVATRTELDWGMKNGQTCIWAPSKLVLDAGGDASPAPQDALEMAVWLADQFDAMDIVAVDSAATPRADVRLLTPAEAGL